MALVRCLVREFSMNLHDCKETSAEDTLLEFFLVFALSGTKKKLRENPVAMFLTNLDFRTFLNKDPDIMHKAVPANTPVPTIKDTV